MGLGTFKAFRFGGLCWNEFHFLQMLCWNRLAYSVKCNRQSLPATIWYVINLTSQRPKNMFIVVFQTVFQHSILPCANVWQRVTHIPPLLRQQRPSRLSHCNTRSRGRGSRSQGNQHTQGTQGTQGSQGRLGRLGSRPTRKCRAHHALPGTLVPLPGGWGMATVIWWTFKIQHDPEIATHSFNMFWPHVFARIILQIFAVYHSYRSPFEFPLQNVWTCDKYNLLFLVNWRFLDWGRLPFCSKLRLGHIQLSFCSNSFFYFW